MAGIDLQNCKIVRMIDPIDTTGATATDTEVDTIGWDYLTVIAVTGNVAANMTALKLQESDASGSGEADISGAAFSNPAASGGDNTRRVCHIDLRKRKRYISTVATGGAGATLISVIGILSRGEKTPTSATERGVDEQLII